MYETITVKENKVKIRTWKHIPLTITGPLGIFYTQLNCTQHMSKDTCFKSKIGRQTPINLIQMYSSILQAFWAFYIHNSELPVMSVVTIMYIFIQSQ